VPLAIALTGAHVHDSKVFEGLIDLIVPIKGKRGRPRRRPEKLHADKGYDYPRCRRFLRKRGIKARIARRGVESSERLGRHRWVVERTLAWLTRCRRLCVRYERRAIEQSERRLYGVLRSSARGYGTPQRKEGYVVLLLPALTYEGVELFHQEVHQ
jgi:transposase